MHVVLAGVTRIRVALSHEIRKSSCNLQELCTCYLVLPSKGIFCVREDEVKSRSKVSGNWVSLKCALLNETRSAF